MDQDEGVALELIVRIGGNKGICAIFGVIASLMEGGKGWRLLPNVDFGFGRVVV